MHRIRLLAVAIFGNISSTMVQPAGGVLRERFIGQHYREIAQFARDHP
jgi:hypothetical protein